MVFFDNLGYNIRTLSICDITMKKYLFLLVFSFFLSTTASAHTSISFSMNQGMPAMMNDYAYNDMLLMEQLQARRMQNRLMRMQMAQMGYPRYVRVIEPMYRNYYYEQPYYIQTRPIYRKQYVRHRQVNCHKRNCVRTH